MDSSIPGSTPNSPLVPVFGDNVQDLLGTGTLNVNPSAIITVNSIADTVDDPNSGVTTLRDAINQANDDTGEDLIVFDRSLFSNAQTITLSQGELDLTHNLDIIAPRDSLTGADLVTVSGNNASRVFEIESGATVSLDGLIVADGQVTDDNGGGIKNSGTLTLDNSIVRNNTESLTANVLSGGGAVYNTGVLTVTNSTVSDNSTKDSDNSASARKPTGYGGGIYNIGILTLNSSTLSSNATTNEAGSNSGGSTGDSNGGGIYNTGVLRVNNSTLSGNVAGGLFSTAGGGIFNADMGVVTVNNSTLSGNTAIAGGGIENTRMGVVTVNNSILSGNVGASRSGGFGGGIDNSGSLTVSDSTLNNNTAGEGGGGISNGGSLTVSDSTLNNNTARDTAAGISNGGSLTVSNSTLSGNSAGVLGGGIVNGGTLTVNNSTFTLNKASKGGGVYNYTPGSTNVRNTIIAANLNNSANGVNPDVFGNFTSNGYNLIGDGTGSTGFDATGDIVGTSDNPIDPRLAPLDFYGGSTQTFALLPDSPAIGAGDPTVLDTDPTTDQRGFPRRASDGRTDIGAFEFSS